MNSIEAKVEQLIAVFHADPAYRRTALAVRCLSSDTRVNQVKAELFALQRECRRNEHNPRVRYPILKRILALQLELEQDPRWVNFRSSYEDLSSLARSIRDELENIS